MIINIKERDIKLNNIPNFLRNGILYIKLRYSFYPDLIKQFNHDARLIISRLKAAQTGSEVLTSPVMRD